MRNDFIGMERRDSIMEEIRIGKLYNVDHRSRKGKVRRNVNKLHPASIPCIVTEIIPQTDSSKTIRLKSENGYLPPFYPGQYINIALEVQGIRTNRPYSLSSSAARRDSYEVTVRRTPTGFVSDYLLNQLKVGDHLEISAPAGQFYRFDAVHGKKLVFIAGGSGITPFISMLKTDRDKFRQDYSIDLIYGCAKQDDIIFLNELEQLEKELAGFSFHPIISEPEADCKMATGFITADFIRSAVPDYMQCTYFMCGPAAMYNFVGPELVKMGIPGRCIRKEVQTMPDDPTMLPAWPEGITSASMYTITMPDGKSFKAKATDTILKSLEQAGFDVRNQCRSGECSLCRLKLLSGKVYQPESALLRRSDMKFGYIHPCVTYPISDIELLI